MLGEHLSQEHDAASRRFALIDRHVAWIHEQLLGGRSARILDLGCGPGLYASRLARLGHRCTGIDFSPASVAHAREQAAGNGQQIEYLEGDLRRTDFGRGYGLVMFIFGEFNVFRPAESRDILQRAFASLEPGGLLLLEPHTFEAVRRNGNGGTSWYSSPSGLFSERPHLCLNEFLWDEATRTATERYYVLDGASGQVTPYAASMQAYTDEEYRGLLEETGFREVAFHPSLQGIPDEQSEILQAITACRMP